MDGDRLAKLTEGQKACLRGVLRHMSSKDIARELDISPHTVDQRLRLAMRALGAGSRVQAAFMLARVEGVPEYQPSAYQSLHIDPAPVQRTVPPTTYERQDSKQQLERVMENQAAFQAVLPLPRQELRLPLTRGGAQPHDLGPLQRLGWIAVIAIASALAFGALLAGLEALAQLGRIAS